MQVADLRRRAVTIMTSLMKMDFFFIYLFLLVFFCKEELITLVLFYDRGRRLPTNIHPINGNEINANLDMGHPSQPEEGMKLKPNKREL